MEVESGYAPWAHGATALHGDTPHVKQDDAARRQIAFHQGGTAVEAPACHVALPEATARSRARHQVQRRGPQHPPRRCAAVAQGLQRQQGGVPPLRLLFRVVPEVLGRAQQPRGQ